ncbi:MAPEG family protein [Enhygromyxa salina]|uniref:MAPEG family protein n=1 Tax=Enhygromyxa salina TaxID=215803 RepID=A0A2S9YUP2_9BACT|nr:MAPEG family protein [Enhygromyxa salina]PRQ08804.1 MAPEG family protein [Enhygromyxa salina]
MTTPFVCVLVAFVSIWLARIPVFVALGRSEQDFDNKQPARQLASLEGFGARAVAAHRGLIDFFAPFAAAVVIAHICGADPRRSAVLAIAFVVSELLYVTAYLANADYLRSFVWLIGVFTILGLFGLAAAA